MKQHCRKTPMHCSTGRECSLRTAHVMRQLVREHQHCGPCDSLCLIRSNALLCMNLLRRCCGSHLTVQNSSDQAQENLSENI